MRDRRGVGRSTSSLVALLATLLLAACGASAGVATLNGGDDPTPTASAGAEDPEEAMFAFAECMREHGVEMPDPVIRRFDGGSSGVVGGGTEEVPAGELPFDPNSDEFQAAEEACDEHLQGLGAMEPGAAPQLSAEEEEAFLAFTECMRENGIDLPDPGTGGTIEIGPDTGFDPGSDDFRAAEEECRSHLQGVMGGDGGFVEPAP